jgi:hypothetical protein
VEYRLGAPSAHAIKLYYINVGNDSADKIRNVAVERRWGKAFKFIGGSTAKSFTAVRELVARAASQIWRRWRRWRRERRRFPIRWLTLKRRIQTDVEDAFNQPGGRAFFSDRYLSELAQSIQQIDNWQIKVWLFQFAIILFLPLSVVSADSSITIFGVSIKGAAGVRESLVVISSMMTLVMALLAYAKDTRSYVIDKAVQLTTPTQFVDLALLGAQSSLALLGSFAHCRLYLFRQLPREIRVLFRRARAVTGDVDAHRQIQIRHGVSFLRGARVREN